MVGKLEVKCSSELLSMVGEEVTECVARQQKIARDVREVFTGEVYRQVCVNSFYCSSFLYDPLGVGVCNGGECPGQVWGDVEHLLYRYRGQQAGAHIL